MSLSRHDALFKQFMHDLTIAKDFLDAHLPEEIKAVCDFNTIAIEPGSYVDQTAKQFHSDILYSLKIADKKGYIFCLIEHQSTPDPLMAFRLLRYQIAVMQRHLDNGDEHLPVILGLVFYHGKESPYPYSLDIMSCFDNIELAKKAFLKPRLIDLTIIPDEEIATHKSVALLELTQKHIRDRDLSLSIVRQLAIILKQYRVSANLAESMLKYIADLGEIEDVKAFFTVFTEEIEEYREVSMTIAEKLRMQGMEQGIQQGMQQGIRQGETDKALTIAKKMLLEGLDTQFIKKITGLSDDELNNL